MCKLWTNLNLKKSSLQKTEAKTLTQKILDKKLKKHKKSIRQKILKQVEKN